MDEASGDFAMNSLKSGLGSAIYCAKSEPEAIQRSYSARIAQSAEQDTLNVKVPSSILGAGTIIRVVRQLYFKVTRKESKRAGTMFVVRLS